MQINLVGLNHKTACVDVRQRLAFDSLSAVDALKELKRRYPKCEFVLLSTCNRVEVYFAASKADGPGHEDISNFLSDYKNVELESFKEFIYTSSDDDTVRHLMTVASSLDSMVLGEPQIVAQVKESFHLAIKAKSSGKILNHLFHTAFSTSKRIYTDTSISSRRVSVAGVAVDLARQLFSDLTNAKIAVIGAGEMGRLLVEHFVHIKCSDITVINRSYDKAHEIAKINGVETDTWDNIEKHLAEANIVVTAATAANGALFDKKSFKKIMKARRGRALLLIDIAVPRNIDAKVNEIENVYLYNVDDLALVVEKNVKLRQEDVDIAIKIIFEKVAEFMGWFETRDIGPLKGRIKETFERIRHEEMEKFFAAQKEIPHCKGEINAAVSRVMNKLLHCVIRNIDVVAEEQGCENAIEHAARIIEHAEEIAEGRNNTEKSEP